MAAFCCAATVVVVAGNEEEEMDGGIKVWRRFQDADNSCSCDCCCCCCWLGSKLFFVSIRLSHHPPPPLLLLRSSGRRGAVVVACKAVVASFLLLWNNKEDGEDAWEGICTGAKAETAMVVLSHNRHQMDIHRFDSSRLFSVVVVVVAAAGLEKERCRIRLLLLLLLEIAFIVGLSLSSRRLDNESVAVMVLEARYWANRKKQSLDGWLEYCCCSCCWPAVIAFCGTSEEYVWLNEWMNKWIDKRGNQTKKREAGSSTSWSLRNGKMPRLFQLFRKEWTGMRCDAMRCKSMRCSLDSNWHNVNRERNAKH